MRLAWQAHSPALGAALAAVARARHSPDFPAPCTLEMREAQATAVLCLRPLSPVVVVAATLALVVVRRRRAARISGGVAAGESVVATAQSPI